MRILLANYAFDDVGGSETYLLTLAEQFLRLGHGVTIYARVPGAMAELARSRAIDVVAEIDELPSLADVLVTQDSVVSYELSERYPTTPQIYVYHSPVFDLQTPPMVPGIVSAVVVMSERFERRLRALDTKHRIVRLRQPVDVERMVPAGPPHPRPRRAILLGNYLRGARRDAIVGAWTSAGIEVAQVGVPAGTASLYPETEIAGADIVVGKGRAILDAMSCGRPAYVYDTFGTDGWVTPAVYPHMEADAFAGLALGRVADAAQLCRDLDDYDPSMGLANRDLVMAHHHGRVHAEQLIALCQELAPAAAPCTTPKGELARLTLAKWRAEAELYALRNEIMPLAGKLARLGLTAKRLVRKLRNLRRRRP